MNCTQNSPRLSGIKGKRADHVRLMNFVREELNGNRDWRNKDGRPSKQAIVEEWQCQNPDAVSYTHLDVYKRQECGVSEQAVRGWCRRNHVAKDAKGSFALSESQKSSIYLHYLGCLLYTSRCV